jgi:hypothetical protein
VRTLVTEQIGGELVWEETAHGTRAKILARVP